MSLFDFILIYLIRLSRIRPCFLPWTPLTNPQTAQEILFNQMDSHTRSTIKRIIGILKGRWMRLDTAGGKLLYKPDKARQLMIWFILL